MSDTIQLWHDPHVCGGMDILRAQCREYRYAPHAHDSFVVGAFKAGAQKHRVARQHGIAYPGMVMVIPPGEIHTGESAQPDQGWAYSAFYPSAECLERISADWLGQASGSLDFPMPFLVEDSQLAEQLLLASDISHASKDVLHREETVYEAMSLLVRRYGRRSHIGTTRPRPEASISRSLEFMHDCFHLSLSIRDIAGESGLSEFHFMRVFKALMNISAHQYLNNLRLESSKALLASGTPAVTVATQVGFYDQSHFTKSFRRAFGTTPNRYANACR